MSYNITSWKTKKIENLIIPINVLYENSDNSWHPEQPKIIDFNTMKVEIVGGSEGFELKGKLNGLHLEVEEITNYGEGSGHFMVVLLEQALKQSTGKLETLLVWENGDCVEKLTINDGEIKREEIS